MCVRTGGDTSIMGQTARERGRVSDEGHAEICFSCSVPYGIWDSLLLQHLSFCGVIIHGLECFFL